MRDTRTSSVDLAARALAADAEHAPKPSADARAKAIAAMGAALRQERRQRRTRVAGFAGLAIGLAAAAAAAMWVARPHTPATPTAHGPVTPRAESSVATALAADDVKLRRGTGEIALTNGEALEAGDRVVVGARGATLGLFRGTRLTLDPSSELAVAGGMPAYTFELGSGAVRADVAKLKTDERFIVRTADAEVEVRGTSFRVTRAEPRASCGNGTTTRVVVFEGVVAVRARGAETLVRAGESWPAGCEETAATPQAPAPAPSGKTAIAAVPSAKAIPSAAPPVAPSPASDLPAQNDMFQRALGQRRTGDAAGAVATLDELLTLHPSSPYAQQALAERMKILYGLDPTKGRAAARDYLARYPNGFARSDANIILEGP